MKLIFAVLYVSRTMGLTRRYKTEVFYIYLTYWSWNRCRGLGCRLSEEPKQDAQLSQRDRAAGCIIVFAKSRTLELGDNDLRTL